MDHYSKGYDDGQRDCALYIFSFTVAMMVVLAIIDALSGEVRHV